VGGLPSVAQLHEKRRYEKKEHTMNVPNEELAGLRGDAREAATARRGEIAARHLRPRSDRPTSSARGVHHIALLSNDVERTVRFYQDVLEFPLTEMFENRDYGGSTHFFFDIGNGNSLAFFDLPGLDLGAYAEVLGGLHHLAIAVERERWEHLRGNLERESIPHEVISHSSMYFNDPDGARLELISDPLGEMYGKPVG
jgi:catechol 2,3-dioxygenase-like lactoylglutathione lyase family enzyme